MLLKFISSFQFALEGMASFFLHERNGKIQLFAAVIALTLGTMLHISLPEWIYIIGCIAMVLSLEMINTAIEQICNMVQPEYHIAVKRIKDIAAAAVLLCAVASFIIGALIFLPKIIALL
jgi:diacylglycerol kinase